jgi:hypothetical protein
VTIFGPDLSHYQDGVDLARVAAEGHVFVIGKVSQGSGSRDPLWPRWRDGAREHGLLLAGYHYIDTSDPARQAANCAGWVGDRSIPLALDWEQGGGNWANFLAVLAAFRAAGLHVALAYCPRWYWQQQGSPDMSKAGLPLWSSRYPTTQPGAPAALYRAVTDAHWAGYGGLPVGLLQFSEAAQIAGHTTDCSAFNGTRDQLAALLGGGPPSDLSKENDVVITPLPVTYFPDGRFRIAAKVETDQIGSALFKHMWISYSALWGDATVAVTPLAGDGSVLPGGIGSPAQPVPIKNNIHQSYDVPVKATTVTLEGKVAHPGDTEVAAFLLAKPI